QWHPICTKSHYGGISRLRFQEDTMADKQMTKAATVTDRPATGVRIMLPIHTILHPTDFSERSRHACQLACALSGDYDAELIILHVARPPAVFYGEGIPLPDPEFLFQEAREQLEWLEVPDP